MIYKKVYAEKKPADTITEKNQSLFSSNPHSKERQCSFKQSIK